MRNQPAEFLDEKFSGYLEDRRSEPRDDVLTELATAKYPDGSTPEIIDVVRTATFLFAAGQETTAKLLSAAIKALAERPDIQQALREDRSLIPTFVEESLRLESPVKSDSRLARRTTKVGDMDVKAGTIVMVLPGAVNRDPRRFSDPHEFQVRRPNVREHIAFGRGAALLPRRAAGAGRGPGVTGTHAGPDGRDHHRRGVPRPGRGSVASTTSRPTSCAGSPTSTSGSPAAARR